MSGLIFNTLSKGLLLLADMPQIISSLDKISFGNEHVEY